MGKIVLTDARLYLGGYDLSGDVNAIALAAAADVQDQTTFGNLGAAKGRRKLAGLANHTFSHAGFFEAENADAALFAAIGAAGSPLTLAGEGADDGELAYLAQVLTGQYRPGGAIGNVLPFQVAGEVDGDLIRGTILHDDAAARTSSGNGTARQLGAIAAGETLSATLHVIAASGTTPTLDVIVESDDNSGMTSATTRASFTQATAIAGEIVTVAGPITDDYWRVSYTIGGTGPSFTFVAAAGIK